MDGRRAFRQLARRTVVELLATVPDTLDRVIAGDIVAEEVERAQRAAVARGRRDGLSWDQVAEHLGVTKQSAWERFRA